MKQSFNQWMSHFKDSIATFDYYVDFQKVINNVDKIKVELCLLNSILNEDNIEEKFKILVTKYPEVIEVIPILLAVRNSRIYCVDQLNSKWYSFDNHQMETVEELTYFMQKSGLFSLFQDRKITNLVDYVTGVEVGLDSNGRKNRCGDIMENFVEEYIIKAGFIKNETYFKEMKTSEISKKWGLNLDAITHDGKAIKKFDFVLKVNEMVYGIETNFYASNGSKLNETARSYKKFALEAKKVESFKFMWITDGNGWKASRQYLEETYEVLEYIFNLNDLANGALERLHYEKD